MKRLLLLLLPSIALAQPTTVPKKVRIERVAPLAEVSAQLEEAIRARDAKAIAPLLRKQGMFVAGMWFPDAACTKRFGKAKKLKKAADITAFAGCLAKLELQPTTRKSQFQNGALLTYAPGIEIEIAIEDGAVYYAGYVHQADHKQRELPTLTAQAFEALRKSGSTNVDAAVEAKLAPEVSKRNGTQVAAWIEVCLDAKGKAKTTVSEATTSEIGKVLLAATADWTFQPFGKGVPVCSHSLVTYPAAKAPKTEVLPHAHYIPATFEIDDEGVVGGVEGGVEGGVAGEWVPGVGWADAQLPPPPPPPSAPPQNVPPTLLEGNRIAGNKAIVPDDTTKKAIAASQKDKIIGSFKMCVDPTGVVTTVSQLKSTGFPAYDAKIMREMKTWGYRPYMVNGKAVPVCTAVTFIYSQN